MPLHTSSAPAPRHRLFVSCLAAALALTLVGCTSENPPDAGDPRPTTVAPTSPAATTPAVEPSAPGSTATAAPGPTTSPGTPEPTVTPAPPATAVPEPTRTPVVPIVTYAGQGPAGTEVYASVNDVVESTGSCTATFTAASGAQVEVVASAVPDAKSTLCDPLVATPGSLSTGTWTVVVTYSSDVHAGASAATTVEVP